MQFNKSIKKAKHFNVRLQIEVIFYYYYQRAFLTWNNNNIENIVKARN